MIRFLILAILLTVMLLPAGAQVIHIEPARFLLQYEDSVYSGMTYMGHGSFMSVRSCRMDWFDVQFTVIRFDCSTKMLTVEGRVMNANWNHGPIAASQTFVGLPTGESRMWGTDMAIRMSFPNENTGCFRHTVGPVQPGDRLAFTTPEPESEDVFRGSAWSKVYDIGRLAECSAEGGDGATLGQR